MIEFTLSAKPTIAEDGRQIILMVNDGVFVKRVGEIKIDKLHKTKSVCSDSSIRESK